MGDEANKKPATREEIREAARKRAIQNFTAAIEYLELPDSEIDEQSCAVSIFLSEMLTTEQAGNLLGVTKHLLAVWRRFQVGPMFVTLKKGTIGYPPEGVRRFLRQREEWAQERQNPRARKRRK